MLQAQRENDAVTNARDSTCVSCVREIQSDGLMQRKDHEGRHVPISLHERALLHASLNRMGGRY